MSSDFRPTAAIHVLQRRARLLAAVRRFFDERGYWEVETPVMSHESVVDAHLDPFVVDGRYYLQTSPELGMKRLLTAGAAAIYQITRAFRRGESGQLHNPEFTMVEWYRVGDRYHDQMDVVEELFRQFTAEFAPQPLSETPFRRRTYDQVFKDIVGEPVLQKTAAQLQELAARRKVTVPETLGGEDRDGWLNVLLAECVEPQLGESGPEFVYDYPATQAALARIDPANPEVAQRFELYVGGLELCNGYDELTDADELRRRIEHESQRRTAEGLPSLPPPERLLAAMDAGLPACSGVALGFDRLMMAVTGAKSIAEVTAFPLSRA